MIIIVCASGVVEKYSFQASLMDDGVPQNPWLRMQLAWLRVLKRDHRGDDLGAHGPQ